MSLRVLVAGAAGFIGSHVVDALLAHGHEVIGLDDLSGGSLANLAQARGRVGFRFVQAALPEVGPLAGIDCVIDLSGRANVPRAVQDPGLAQDDLARSVALMKAAAAAGVPRFLAASSASVLGECRTMRPLSAYGRAKLALEKELEGLRRPGWFALRLFNVFGPRQGAAGGALVPRLLAALGAGHPVEVQGDGLQSRDFVFAGDVARAFVAALTAKPAGVPEIGTGRAVTVLELVRLAAEVAGVKPEIVHVPARAADLRDSRARPGGLVGWVHEVTLREGLARTWAART